MQLRKHIVELDHVVLALVARKIDVCIESFSLQQLLHLLGIVEVPDTNRDNQNLSRRQPERPLTSKMLSQDSRHSLNGSQDGSVDHHRALDLSRVILASKFQLKSVWQLEVELDSGTLVPSSQGIRNHDVDLWTVERTIPRVQLPFAAPLVQGALQLCFCVIPGLDIPHVLLWSRGQLHLEFETEYTVDVLQEVKNTRDLILDLVLGTENVRIVLLKSSDPGQAG
ncbi:hypothetical protein OGATHE_006352 [Ogataea polymorpha]|uniref:Uncharacterized protein n=1 Tax=Ogataea polymorpha TaxID=460523 RepID=A0A9P8NTH7_9ASCO|nr:hypothetical protein OGATHE_006352 [Ogataea polymorpha]